MHPAYRWPQSFGKVYSLSGEGYLDCAAQQRAEASAAGGASTMGSAPDSAMLSDEALALLQTVVLLPWGVDAEGKVVGFKIFQGFDSRRAAWDDMVQDAHMWQHAVARDVR